MSELGGGRGNGVGAADRVRGSRFGGWRVRGFVCVFGGGDVSVGD